MKQWRRFGDQLPNIGQAIELRFDDGKEFGEHGILTSITPCDELGGGAVIVAHTKLGQAWSLCSDRYVNSVVKAEYLWRPLEKEKH